MTTTHTTHPRGLFDARITKNTPLCREHYLITLKMIGPDPFPPTKPGQFVQLGCGPQDWDALESCQSSIEWPKDGPPKTTQAELLHPQAFLRRPFSLAGRRDTPDGAEIDIIHRVVGIGTEWLEHLRIGDKTQIIGPLGNDFSLPTDKSIGLLVGGGVGLPPMFYLAEALNTAGRTGCAFVGAMTHDLLAITPTDTPPDTTGTPLPTAEEFNRHNIPTVITTNDGSHGLKGLITDGLLNYLQNQPIENLPKTIIYTCGPEPMMEAVGKIATQFNVQMQACVEQAMACGMGTCQSCIVKIRGLKPGEIAHGHLDDGTPWRYRLACTDGPVFPAPDVIW